MLNAKKPRKKSRLSAAMLKSDLAPGKYHDGGGMGLFLRADENGGKFWVQRITINKRRCELGLGSPPVVTLAMARDQALENKRTIRNGGDPLAEKRRRQFTYLNFAQAVDRYLDVKLSEFRNEKHQKQWRSTLDKYAVPIIGGDDLNAIEVQDILRVLKPIWLEKTETASRLRGRIEAVLSWATVAGHRKGDNPARWKGNLSELLPKPSKVVTASNFPALSRDDAPRWWAELSKRDGMSAEALRFACLTASRSGEVRGMVWDEVNLGKRLWIIPAERMKSRREHREPLTDQAMAILSRIDRLERQAIDDADPAPDYVFFAPRGGPLSDMSISAVMRRMQAAEETAGRIGFVDQRSGRAAVPHGLRSTFRDWAAEQGVDHHLAELALAHRIGSLVERAYRRTDMVEKRRELMASWATFLTGK